MCVRLSILLFLAVDRSFDVEVQGSSPSVDYYSLNLELDCVHWVDDERTLDKCHGHITMVTKAVFVVVFCMCSPSLNGI